MYERIGLRVTVYKEGPPEIDITLDPSALPTSDEAAEASNAAWAKSMESETFVLWKRHRLCLRYRLKDVDPELFTDPHLQEHPEGREEYREDDA